MYQEKPSIDILMHYGMPRRSGRYPWGSGENPYQHSIDFLGRYEQYKKQGLSEKEIAEAMGLRNTSELRIQKTLATNERRAYLVQQAKSMKSDGYSPTEIARKFTENGTIEGKVWNESTIRSLLNESSEVKTNEVKATADILKKMVDEKGMLDVGTGVELELGISKERLKDALYILEQEGYPNYISSVKQATNANQKTNIKVLCPPGTEWKEAYDYDKISTVKDYEPIDISNDAVNDGTHPTKFEYPASMDSSRLMVRYAEDGGEARDGTIEIRRGVEDLSLGNSHYAQVRILVDNDRYLKGMAFYKDDMPPGVDVIFNTNKTKDVAKMDTLKKIKDDPDNPFGSLIKADGQSYYYDKNGNKQLSLINKRAEEGDWGSWNDKLPSQFLSKQSLQLIKKQLNLTYADKDAEFNEICELTNPTIKRRLLRSFADDCDAAAVHLKAAALPRQKYQVILPVDSLKDTEVYAPNYKNGEQVALVRYPHGGTFEIPIVTVNNKQAEAKSILGNAKDAIGINSRVAGRLSGADFDGDTVMVIPLSAKTKITSTRELEGLKGFDPKKAYPYKEGMKVMKRTDLEMGKISNLITDMTLRGANSDELARAVRHSMVVIDAAKHKLNYKQSEIDNNIEGLKRDYQKKYADGKETGKYGGASTLISKASAEIRVPETKGQAKIDPETGKLIYKQSGREYVDYKTGKTKIATKSSTRMAETDNAYTLSSGHPKEEAYADYANKMKALANSARKEYAKNEKVQYSKTAAQTYRAEVDKLNADLNLALKNAPKERKAQMIAASVFDAKQKANPDLTSEEKKKLKTQALAAARVQVGAKSTKIEISDRQWEAIQAGAISDTKLSQILNHTDLDKLKERATPRNSSSLSDAKVAKLKAMSASGYSNAEIAEALGVSPSTVHNYL